MPPVSQRPHRLAGVLACLLVAAVGLAGCPRNPAAEAQEGRSLLNQIKSVGVVKVGTRVDNPPHSGYDANGAWVGFDNDNEPSLAVLDVPGGTGVKLDGIAMRKNDSTLRMAVNLALQGRIEVWPNG